MLRGEIKNLISHLSGDEHTWIDLKEDYSIDYARDNSAKSDFIQDIAALANTVGVEARLDLRYLDDNERYILVGVNDDGDPVGANEHLGEYTSILTVDPSVPQNIIADYLFPTPDVQIHKYDDQEPYFVLLIVSVTQSPPVTIQRNLENLREGDVYVRDGDRNRPATREDYEQFINFHLDKEREYVTEGLRQMVGIDIDYLRDLGRVEIDDESEDDPVVPVRPGDEGPTVQSSLRSPIDITSLTRELNADITKWRCRSNYSSSLEGLYEYYTNSGSIEPSIEKLAFLAQCAWRHAHIGAYWVGQMEDLDFFIEMLDRIDLRSFEGNNALHLGKFLAVTCSEDTTKEFVELTNLNTNYGSDYGSIVLRSAAESGPNDVLSTTGSYRAEHLENPDWNLENMDLDELTDVVRRVASELHHLAVNSPGVTPSGLKGWLRNAEIYIAYNFIEFDSDLDQKISHIITESD